MTIKRYANIAEAERIELPKLLLESSVLPLNYHPIYLTKLLAKVFAGPVRLELTSKG